MKKLFIFCLMITASFCLVVTANTADVVAAVPNPTVTGPIPATATPGDPSRNYPFFASQFDLKARGYVEQEFFIEGTANRYIISSVTATGNGTGKDATIQDSGHPYKTRIVVRRPAHSAHFSGVVIVEWQNVTNGWDMENSWFQVYDYILRSGHAWVGVSAQRIGVNYLKSWNPTRYGSLVVDHLADGTTITNDALAYDILSQVVQSLRNPLGIDPLGGLFDKCRHSFGWHHFTCEEKCRHHDSHAKHGVFIAMGHSQSASQLSTYVNNVEPLARVIDGFALHGDLGVRIRTDLVAPVWKVLSEFDVQGMEARVRRPDDQLFVTWEVTGTSHNDYQSYQSRVFLERRDNGSAVEDALVNCTYQPVGSKIPFHYAFGAGLKHLIHWIKTGEPIPAAPPIEVTSIGPPTALERDSYGNAVGGLRLPQVDVPTTVSVGTNAGPGTCSRWGYTQPFTDIVLESLYPNHHKYVHEVFKATFDSLKAGYILPEDAEQTLKDAIHSSVGK